MLHYWAGPRSSGDLSSVNCQAAKVVTHLEDRPSLPESAVGLVCPGLRDPGARVLKRILDVIVAAILLILSLPLAAAIALAIVLEKRGPVFFAHTRIGKGKRRFRLWKFRSMVVDADAMLARHLKAHPDDLAEWREMHKLKDDPRVTRVGRLLRRSRLDELPQLISVLRGEMSMVGPRPVFPLYVQVLPGLTGLWQISGHTHTSYRERTELDMKYMRERTIWMDLLILLKTVRVVIFGRGAY
jgi:lipopolysaccharide/colanic/teichoic acid biosynthesis glycosyltransferase